MTNLIADVEINIKSPVEKVWEALTDPEQVPEYMFGSKVESTWKEGGRIVWKGNWKGRAYRDKGVIVQMKPGKVLQYTHYSPLSGLPDTPENYHVVTIELSEKDGGTFVRLTQDNNADLESRDHSEKNWAIMLEELKKHVEGS